jgi:hypothetical protein
MKIEAKLARAFQVVATQEQRMETTASSILSIVRGAKALTAKKFDGLVERAYAANGWNARPGRPNGDGPAKDAVPDTVRTYVTTIRRAIRARLKVAKFTTFSALRTALAEKAERTAGTATAAARTPTARANGHARIPKDLEQNFVGVAIEQPAEPNGALFHDLAATYVKLPQEHRDMLGRQLAKLLHKYLPLVTSQRGAARKAA